MLNKYHDQILFQAVRANNFETATKAIALGANVNCFIEDGWTPLLEAVNVDAQMVHVLLQKGADPNASSMLGYTPLMRAANLGKLEVIKMLVAVGANVLAKDINDCTAFRLAQHEKQHVAANYIADRMAQALVQNARAYVDEQEVIVPLPSHVRTLIDLTRASVGGRVYFLGLTFADGTTFKTAKVLFDVAIVIPSSLKEKSVEIWAVLSPMADAEQDVSKNQGSHK